MQHIAWKRGLGVLRNLEQTRLTYRELNWYVVSTVIIKIVGQLTNPRLEFKNLHKFVTLLVYFVTTSATLNLHWWKIWQVYPCVNMQILFMHSLQELHQETLQTFGATFICSVLDLWREERKARNYVLSSAWAYVWMVGFQGTLYTVVCMFTFAECSPSLRRKVFSFHNTDPWDIISLLFMPPKEGLYLHASLSFFSQLFSSLDVTG